ncbi:N-6 DNA methylase [Burkholderia sp. AU28863]|uniref:HsdM family class I SAM-dependent methyltransferase n=1 Tax=Burkholderia sp. AU28863 TaxID=2015352 RepID=UPI000B7A7D8D|nr:N-6 DNA methylase [Burkholderia sp. AU28863]OXI66459.1 N-6 DNA methylase [Burkholderia sp. AU28863]
MLPQDQQGFTRLLRMMKPLLADAITPRDLIQAVLLRWHKLAFRTLRAPTLSVRKELKQHATVHEFSEWLAERDVMDAAFWLSSAYAALLDKDIRKKQAMYFTPPYLSGRVLDNAGRLLRTGKIIDPACGGAAFLVPAAHRIAQEMEFDGCSSEEIIEHIEGHLYGSDTDSFLCVLAAAFIRMALAAHIIASGREPKLRILVADGLNAFGREAGTFDLVLSNPPYRKMTADDCEPYRAEYSDVMLGQPNLYTMFIRRATRLLRKGGRAVLLTPMSFLSGQSFSKVREALSHEGAVAQFDLIHDKDGIFLGAEQDAVVTVWIKDARERTTRVFALSVNGKKEFIGRYQMVGRHGPWPIPRRRQDVELLTLFGSPASTLRDYGYVAKTGAVVIHRSTRPTFAKLADCKRASCAIPLLWSRDIEKNGRLEFRESAKLADRYVDVRSLDSPGVVTNSCVVYQRVTSSDQPSRLVCAPVPKRLFDDFGGIIGENHVGILERTSSRAEISPLLLSKVLRTETVDRLFRCISGATNVSAYEIESLPLPDTRRLKDALRRGLQPEDAVRCAYGLATTQVGEARESTDTVGEGDHERAVGARAAA